MKVTVKESGTSTKLMDSLRKLKSCDVLVGVPQKDDQRQDEFGNAAIMYIAEYGSPINNIPPRPVLTIGLDVARDKIIDIMEGGLKSVLGDKAIPIEKTMDLAGLAASSSVKRVIDTQLGIEHIAFSTMLGRLRRGFEGDKALLVTGQFRNSITWVVRSKNGTA